MDFEYLNVFFGKLKLKKMPKFETLSALRGLMLQDRCENFGENGHAPQMTDSRAATFRS